MGGKHHLTPILCRLCRILLKVVCVLLLLAVALYVLVPLLVWTMPQVAQQMFFLNLLRMPFVDFSDFASHGVHTLGRNFHIFSDNERSSPGTASAVALRLGVWHLLPGSLSAQLRSRKKQSAAAATNSTTPTSISDDELERTLNESSQAILLYFHGNGFDRTKDHRCGLYNVLTTAMDFHVLVVDYRGYGDSEGYPDERGLVDDALALFHYARRMAPKKRVYVWGHSMGTGVAVQAVKKLGNSSDFPPEALILEAPFNNLPDVVSNHPIPWPWQRSLPCFDSTFIRPIIRSGLVMDSEKHIASVRCPVLVLHAADDRTIWVELGRRLVAKARAAHGRRRVEYVEFAERRHFGHNNIYQAEEVSRLVVDFARRTHWMAKGGAAL